MISLTLQISGLGMTGVAAASARVRRALRLLVPILILAPLSVAPVSTQGRDIWSNQVPASHAGWLNVIWTDGPGADAVHPTFLLVDDGEVTWRFVLSDSLARRTDSILGMVGRRVRVTFVLPVEGAGVQSTGTPEPALLVQGVDLAEDSPSSTEGTPVTRVSEPALKGEQRWVTIPCKFSDVSTEPRSQAYFQEMYRDSAPGLDHYWREQSYGSVNLNGSTAVGWVPLPSPFNQYVSRPDDRTYTVDISKLLQDCASAAGTLVDYSLFSGLNVMLNEDLPSRVSYGGIRTLRLQGVLRTVPFTLVFPWAYMGVAAVAHEMGHGFGLPHSSGASVRPYDSPWDVMSDPFCGCPAANDPVLGCPPQHTIAYHKDRLGWIPADRRVSVDVAGPTTIALERVAQPTGLAPLLAVIPTGSADRRFLTVEARHRAGYDTKLPGDAVIIHDVVPSRDDGRPAHVIDIDENGDPSDEGAMWRPGESFVDPVTGIRVTVMSVTPTGFNVSVSGPGGAPWISSISPSGGPTAGGTVITLSGAGLVPGQTTVTISGTQASNVTVSSPTTLTATTPAGLPGAATVDVTTPGGRATLVDGFTYYSQPRIDSVTPSTGSMAGGAVVTLTGANFVPGATSVFVGGVAAGAVSVTSETSLSAQTPPHPVGPVAVAVTTPGGSASVSAAFTYLDAPLVYSAYLAEGTTSAFFDTRIAVLNPGVVPTTAALLFTRGGGERVSAQVPVPALTRVTVDPKTIAGLAQAEFATTVTSDQLLVVDRTMRWDVTGYGSHAETALERPGTTWYLAEGATHSGFNLFYLLQNPNAAEAQVRVRYLRPSGAPLDKTYALAPNSRTNIWVDLEDFPGLGKALASTDVSAVFEVLNGQPIIVERAMYLDVPGQTFGAGHESAGITAPAMEWFLAEGATGPYFDLFVLIANPGSTDADVEATYLLPDGTTVVKPYRVAGNSRFNIWVDYEGAQLADTAVSTTIRSTNGVPVIVERAMWWPDGGWYEAHNSPGATTTGTKWALAEGEVDASRNLETYILVANTSPTLADVKVTLLFEDGTSAEQTYPGIPAKSRFNVPVGGFFPHAAGKRFGAIVESLGTAPAQIVVERAMYWDAAGQQWAAGTNALATKLQ